MEFMIKAELAAYKSSDPKVKKQTFREKVNSAIYDQVGPVVRLMAARNYSIESGRSGYKSSLFAGNGSERPA